MEYVSRASLWAIIIEKFISAYKIVVGLIIMAISAVVQGLVLLILLPSREARIRACNWYGKIVGPFFIWLTGIKLTHSGREHLSKDRPAIIVSNHTSIVDIFLAIWFSPFGTVGVAKKEVMYYPFFGQLYLMSGHLRIDRGNSAKAQASINRMGELVKKAKLSIFIWPEGTRSRNGRLLPFKKGLVHLAKQTGLPVVPMVVQGMHRCWEKSTMSIRGVPVHVDVLPPIDTSHWSPDNIEEALEEVHVQFRNALPREQRPIDF